MELDKSRYCPQCGAPVEKGSHTCEYCGASLIDNSKEAVQEKLKQGFYKFSRITGERITEEELANQEFSAFMTKLDAENIDKINSANQSIDKMEAMIKEKEAQAKKSNVKWVIFAIVCILIGPAIAIISTLIDQSSSSQASSKQSNLLAEQESARADSIRCGANMLAVEAAEKEYLTKHRRYTSDTLDLKKIIPSIVSFSCPTSKTPYSILGTKSRYRIRCNKHRTTLEGRQ